jgi:hypothetical protein
VGVQVPVDVPVPEPDDERASRRRPEADAVDPFSLLPSAFNVFRLRFVGSPKVVPCQGGNGRTSYFGHGLVDALAAA